MKNKVSWQTGFKRINCAAGKFGDKQANEAVCFMQKKEERNGVSSQDFGSFFSRVLVFLFRLRNYTAVFPLTTGFVVNAVAFSDL